MFYFGKVNITFAPTMAVIIAAIVLDLIFVVIGSLLWKKANLIDPASKKIVGDEEAAALLKGSKGTPRKGWEEFYRV